MILGFIPPFLIAEKVEKDDELTEMEKFLIKQNENKYDYKPKENDPGLEIEK